MPMLHPARSKLGQVQKLGWKSKYQAWERLDIVEFEHRADSKIARTTQRPDQVLCYKFVINLLSSSLSLCSDIRMNNDERSFKKYCWINSLKQAFEYPVLKSIIRDSQILKQIKYHLKAKWGFNIKIVGIGIVLHIYGSYFPNLTLRK